MKLKDAQMRRLQGKVRDFIKMEKELKERVAVVEKQDMNLVSKLEQAMCFGKVLFITKPILTDMQKAIQSTILSKHRDEFRKRDQLREEAEA